MKRNSSTYQFIASLIFVLTVVGGTAFFLYSSAWDMRKFLSTFGSLNSTVIICPLLISVGSGLRALRWQLISGLPNDHYIFFWRATQLGYFGNIVYPARAGEVIRVIAASRWTSASISTVTGWAALDRISDGLFISFLIPMLVFWGIQDDSVWKIGLVFGGFFVIGALVLSFFIWKGPQILAKVPFPQRFITKIHEMLAGLQIINNRQIVFKLIGVNLIILMFDLLPLYFLTRAFDWDLPFTAIIALYLFLTAGSVLPSTPGYVGIYQIACTAALAIFHIPASEALAFSVVWQALIFGVFIVQGGGVALKFGITQYKT